MADRLIGEAGDDYVEGHPGEPHSYDVVMENRYGEPTRVVCGACPASWDIARRTPGT